MPKFYKPTAEEVRIVRAAATKEGLRWGGTRRAFLEPGIRVNVEDENKPTSINLKLVTDHPTWDDTDLHDFGMWEDFVAGFEVTESGEAEIDFYVSRVGRPGSGEAMDGLVTNVQAIFDAEGLLCVESTMEPTLWKRGAA